MRFVHFSDTHLGYAAFRKITEAGYNQREEDINNAFIQAIDKIIELKPDFALHSGDLFDSVRPTNRIIRLAIEQILRLIQNNIPLILISGNHETPKQRYLGSVFSILGVLPYPDNLLKVSHNGIYDQILVKDNLTIHAISQCANGELFQKELKKIELNPKTYNILTMHCGISGMQEFSHGDFNELLVDYQFFQNHKFNYIALGHYHNHIQVGPRAFFAGSTERLSFNEAGKQKGLVEVILDKETTVRFHELKTRPMLELNAINAQDKEINQLTEEIENHIKNAQPQDKILRFKVENVPSHIFENLDIKKFRELAKDALHFEPIIEKKASPEHRAESRCRGKETFKPKIGGLIEEYKTFINHHPGLSEEEKKELEEQGRTYLAKVLEESKK